MEIETATETEQPAKQVANIRGPRGNWNEVSAHKGFVIQLRCAVLIARTLPLKVPYRVAPMYKIKLNCIVISEWQNA